MTYTITASHPDGEAEWLQVGTREEADTLYGEYLRLYPSAEVRLLDGDMVLASAGPKP